MFFIPIFTCFTTLLYFLDYFDDFYLLDYIYGLILPYFIT
ncbi:hypothetical protein BHY_1514 (plasmid) [Borrelia nietonii YOR]|uniref:Uncharacterized protein n=2 Tax=Borrelia TaxID=138 RepID=W5SBJ8_9SPIR|nr:hypothetical protein BHY_1514 [Borrelia nietonii YOR]AHH14719.1 hypothetical protein BHW_0900052 [Borrelia hermsii MTW]